MSDSLSPIERALDYRFRDSSLLARALTHSSSGAPHNERLEFLGDAVLEMVISAALFSRHQDLDEGVLSRWRAALVNRKSLAGLARRLQLGDSLQLGSGESKTGGRQRDSILANAFEALVGAAFVDSDYDNVRDVVLRVFGERLNAPDAPATLVDSKSRLQEELQSRALPLPSYSVESITGLEHEQTFHVLCEISASGIRTEGEGGSRRAAEQAAAARALSRLQHA